MTINVPEAMSWSLLMAREIKDNATATMNEAVAIVFSRVLRCFTSLQFFWLWQASGTEHRPASLLLLKRWWVHRAPTHRF